MYSKFQVLLVEDNPADARMTQMALRDTERAMDIHTVESGTDALAFLRREGPHAAAPRPDLVLLDLNLPGVSGHEVLETVKTDEALRGVPVVIFSSSDAATDVRKSYELHANCYITKPMDFDRFSEVMGLVRQFWFDASVRLPDRV